MADPGAGAGGPDFIAFHAAQRADKTACVELASGRRFTYAQFDRRVADCARWLSGLLGPCSGERVAMLSRNSAEVLVLHFACARAGAIFQPVNWRLTAAELAVVIEDARPALFLHEAEFDDVARDLTNCLAGAPVVRLTPAADTLQALFDTAPAATPVAADWEQPSTLLYTSGTTGKPKGVIVTAKNGFFTGVNFSMAVGLTSDSVLLCDMPMFHVVGLYVASRSVLQQGGVLLISDRFDAGETLKRLNDPALGITHAFAVPQMAQRLYEHPDRPTTDFSRLKALCTGGAPNPTVSVQTWTALGVPMADGFGMSEIGTGMTMPIGDIARIHAKAGSSGLPSLAIEVRLVGAEGRDVEPGEVGEIWVRGPSVTPGYWNNPEATAAAFHDDWFRTGDAARRDADGFYFLVDRIKDMYISGGENVYPAEVEATILELDGVSEVAIVGLPHPEWGECGLAFVIAAPGAAVTEAAILDHCRARLARYKAPRRILFTDDLPRTASGKVQKGLLRDRAMGDPQTESAT